MMKEIRTATLRVARPIAALASVLAAAALALAAPSVDASRTVAINCPPPGVSSGDRPNC
jgi:hypothetical protein